MKRNNGDKFQQPFLREKLPRGTRAWMDFAYFIDLKNLMIIVPFWYYCMPTNYRKIIAAYLKGFPK